MTEVAQHDAAQAPAAAEEDPRVTFVAGLRAELLQRPDNAQAWSSLLAVLEEDNDPEPLAAAYEQFLGVFPLCYGYWLKWAALERTRSGNGAARAVLERAVDAFPNSADLWAELLSLVIEDIGGTEQGAIRDLAERGVAAAGADFQAGANLWDRYIQFEQAQHENLPRVRQLFERVCSVPLAASPVLIKRFEEFVCAMPVAAVFADAPDALEDLRQRAAQASGSTTASGQPTDDALRLVLVDQLQNAGAALMHQVSMLASFEARMTRHYYHFVPLEPQEVVGWNAYLDFAEAQLPLQATVALYERALVPCAEVADVWLRFVHFLVSHDAPMDRIKTAFSRSRRFLRHEYGFGRPSVAGCWLDRLGSFWASPDVRLEAAMFFEEKGMADDAHLFYEDCMSVAAGSARVATRVAHYYRRRGDADKALETLERSCAAADPSSAPYLAVVTAKFVMSHTGDADRARAAFEKCLAAAQSSVLFWIGFAEFERSQVGVGDDATDALDEASARYAAAITMPKEPKAEEAGADEQQAAADADGDVAIGAAPAPAPAPAAAKDADDDADATGVDAVLSRLHVVQQLEPMGALLKGLRPSLRRLVLLHERAQMCPHLMPDARVTLGGVYLEAANQTFDTVAELRVLSERLAWVMGPQAGTLASRKRTAAEMGDTSAKRVMMTSSAPMTGMGSSMPMSMPMSMQMMGSMQMY